MLLHSTHQTPSTLTATWHGGMLEISKGTKCPCCGGLQLKQHLLELQQTRESLQEQVKASAMQEEEWEAVHSE